MAVETNEGCEAKVYELKAEAELRFEIPVDCKNATISLTRGSAEIEGIELALKRAYVLTPGTSRAVFTWHGATVVLSAPTNALAYVASDTPMPTYLVAHAALQERRAVALRSGAAGPRALVVGPRDAGKTALVRTLAAYCVRENGAVLVGDLDSSGMGAVCLAPETLALSAVEHLDLEDGGLVHERVSAFMLGHQSPADNLPVTRAVYAAFASVVERHAAVAENRPHVGAIFDTCGDVERSDGAQCVVVAATALKADVVFVLGAERLCASIRQLLESEGGVNTEVVLLNKSGGVVSRDANARRELISRGVRAYFYGPDSSLSPFRVVVDLKELTLLKVGGVRTVVPKGLLAVGAESTLDPIKPTPIKLTKDLLHAVLALSQADNEDDVLTSPVFGYVQVVLVDVDKSSVTVLAPSTGKIPGKFLLVGNTKWIE